jgi:threonine dehydratase
MTPARELLSRHLPRTRLVEAVSLTEIAKAPVRLKLESELPTGSFKVRGAIYALSVNQARRAIPEVVASSTGNHGAAVAYAARLLGVRATIFLPANPNPVKRANIARQGAEIVEQGNDLAQAFLLADAHAQRTGALFLNDATDADIPDGAGTIADEIVDDCPDLAAIYVPVGDTALIRGVAWRAKTLKPSVRIIGVQAARAPSYWQSWRSGVPTSTESADTIADGLATRTPVAENVDRIRALVDDMRLVTEDAMVAAVGRLALKEHLVAEPSGAATTAAFLNELKQRPAGMDGPVVLLVTGCNIPPALLRRAIATTADS